MDQPTRTCRYIYDDDGTESVQWMTDAEWEGHLASEWIREKAMGVWASRHESMTLAEVMSLVESIYKALWWDLSGADYEAPLDYRE